MIDEIIKAFKQRIANHSWIDDKTRKGVEEKVRVIVWVYIYIRVDSFITYVKFAKN